VGGRGEPAAAKVTCRGCSSTAPIVAHLFASTTGTDADWVVKLIDVYPDSVADHPQMGGYELIVNADILRGRYWKGFARATPILANTVTAFTVDLHGQLYRFRKGHRLTVHVPEYLVPALRSQSPALRA
jgi:predicted acyl esterase